MPHKRYKHSKCHKKDQPKRLIIATNVVNATRVPPKCPINAARYVTPRYATKKIRKYQPERLINATKVQPKHSINNKNTVHTTNVHPQRPINATVALNATKNDPPERLINATSAVNAAHVEPQPHKKVRPQRPMKKLQKL